MKKYLKQKKIFHHLVAGGGEGHGLQPLVGHPKVERGQLGHLLGDALHNLTVDLRHLILVGRDQQKLLNVFEVSEAGPARMRKILFLPFTEAELTDLNPCKILKSINSTCLSR